MIARIVTIENESVVIRKDDIKRITTIDECFVKGFESKKMTQILLCDDNRVLTFDSVDFICKGFGIK